MTTQEMKENLEMYHDQTLHVLYLFKLSRGVLKSLYKSDSQPEKEMLQVRQFKFTIVKCDPLSKNLALPALIELS